MTTLALIDEFLALPFVRWIILATLIASLGVIGYDRFRIWTLKAENMAQASTITNLLGAYAEQNAGVEKTRKEMDILAAQVDTASKTATQIRKDTKATVQDILKQNLVGSCPDMVAESVRILQGVNRED